MGRRECVHKNTEVLLVSMVKELRSRHLDVDAIPYTSVFDEFYGRFTATCSERWDQNQFLRHLQRIRKQFPRRLLKHPNA